MRGGRNFQERGGLVFFKRERGWGGGKGGTGGAAPFVHGNYKFFKGIILTVLERMNQFIMGGGGRTGGAAQSDSAWKQFIIYVYPGVYSFRAQTE